jgi:HD superfamily phosphohydrolase
LAVEEKGIYSVEKFIVARRLMYWQVYLHKTALCAEKMLVRTLQRARRLALQGVSLGVPQPLGLFLALPNTPALGSQLLLQFCQLSDDDVNLALKLWAQAAPCTVLQDLSHRLVNRRLLKLRFGREPAAPALLAAERERWATELNLPSPADAEDYVFAGEVSNLPYASALQDPDRTGILILGKDGQTRDLADAADMSNLQALSHRLTKHYTCTPG